MRKVVNFVVFVLCYFPSILLYADPLKDPVKEKAVFHDLFENWTKGFNNKDLTVSCALFSKSVIADYRGVPQKNYDDICNGFQKIFKDPNRKYQYRFKLHDVYHSGDLAAVRITWYLVVEEQENNKKVTHTIQDEGLDVLEKNKDGKWQIVNYIGYEK